jgi:chromate transporter
MKTLNEPSIAHLARAFLHLGLTAFGGLAMVEPMRKMAVDKQGWLRQEEFLDGLALFGVGLGVWGLGWLQPDLGRMTRVFLKIGVVSFGGGYAMIPILQWDVVNAWHWLTLKQFMDGILLGFITPGPIIILATFVGYRVYGLWGAGVVTIAVFLPPILMIIFLTPYYQRLKEARWMRPVIQGILAALVGMLALVTLQMGQAALAAVPDLLLTAGAAILLIVFEVNLLWIVPAVAGLSLFIF